MIGNRSYYPMEPFVVSARSVATIFTEEQLRDHLNLFDDSSYDDTLVSMTDTALHVVEDQLGEFLEPTTVIQPYKEFSQEMPLVHSRITSVSSITYRATGGTVKTVPTTVYIFDTSSKDRAIRLRSGQQWPKDLDRDYSAPVSVTYVAQWTTPPSSLTHAILLTLGDLFENRNNSAAIQFNTVPTSVKYLIDPHVRRRF